MSEFALRAAHAEVLSDRSIQFDFPTLAQPRPPEWLRWLGDALKAIAPFLEYAFWGGLALALAVILFLIVREVIRVRWSERKGAAVLRGMERPERARTEALLADADRLAAEGRFAEAVHLLLRRTLGDLGEREPAFVRPALTSREIAAIEAMPAKARRSFAEIAGAVERAIFAGRPVDADEFAACRRAYEAFAAPEAWT